MLSLPRPAVLIYSTTSSSTLPLPFPLCACSGPNDPLRPTVSRNTASGTLFRLKLWLDFLLRLELALWYVYRWPGRLCRGARTADVPKGPLTRTPVGLPCKTDAIS